MNKSKTGDESAFMEELTRSKVAYDKSFRHFKLKKINVWDHSFVGQKTP